MKKFKINGSSMMPYFKHGDVIELSKINKFKLGDIIVFNSGDVKIWHRVVYLNLNKSYAITKGDNCLHFDSFKLMINENKEYYILRHKGQKIVAKISKFYGQIFYIYIKFFHKNNILSKFCHSKFGNFSVNILEKLQLLNLKLLLYLNCLDLNIGDYYD